MVAQRAADPTIDHARRARDAHGLAEHAHDVRGRVLSDRSQLTEVERGIALDGLDAATTYPAFEPGKLFNRSHRVKGLDALRYRAPGRPRSQGNGLRTPGSAVADLASGAAGRACSAGEADEAGD